MNDIPLNPKNWRNGRYADQWFSDGAEYLLAESAKTEAEIIARLNAQRSEQYARIQEGLDAANALALERLATDAMTIEERRSALREAIASHAEAVAKVQEAEVNLDRAKERCASADAELRSLDFVDGRIAEFYAEQVRLNRHDAMPPDLIEVTRRRSDLITAAQINVRTVQKFEAELNVAQEAAGRATQQRHRAAARVVRWVATPLADELDAAEQRAASLRDRLYSLGTCLLGELPDGTATTLSLPYRESQLLQKPRPEPLTNGEWKAAVHNWHKRLMEDAEAEFEG